MDEKRMRDIIPNNVEVCNRHSGPTSSWCRLSCAINHETGKLTLRSFLDVIGPYPFKRNPETGVTENQFSEYVDHGVSRIELFRDLLKNNTVLKRGLHFYDDAVAVNYGTGQSERIKEIFLVNDTIYLVGEKYVGRLAVSV
ncbi:MAG: hypothetical protein Q4E47_03035 [Candidatus Saccharibacteria bacterium]|nr:hypothetical protein [Candidatus Saccharibacteria bacterium]